MDKVFPFILKDIFIPNIIFRLNHSFKPESDEIEVDTNIEINFSHKGKDLTVQVKVELTDGKNVPFAFVVEGVGVFRFKDKPPGDSLEKVARINCAAIIFPYIRESVADLTRRAGVPPLHLQPVNFVALMKQLNSGAEKVVTKPQKKAIKKSSS